MLSVSLLCCFVWILQGSSSFSYFPLVLLLFGAEIGDSCVRSKTILPSFSISNSRSIWNFRFRVLAQLRTLVVRTSSLCRVDSESSGSCAPGKTLDPSSLWFWSRLFSSSLTGPLPNLGETSPLSSYFVELDCLFGFLDLTHSFLVFTGLYGVSFQLLLSSIWHVQGLWFALLLQTALVFGSGVYSKLVVSFKLWVSLISSHFFSCVHFFVDVLKAVVLFGFSKIFHFYFVYTGVLYLLFCCLTWHVRGLWFALLPQTARVFNFKIYSMLCKFNGFGLFGHSSLFFLDLQMVVWYLGLWFWNCGNLGIWDLVDLWGPPFCLFGKCHMTLSLALSLQYAP